MDILLTHGYFMQTDPVERKVRKPYPPLGLLYISAYLKSRGFGVEVFDTTFSSMAATQAHLRARRPPVVGIYCNLMTRQNVLALIRTSKEIGAIVIVGGPEPINYAAEYLQSGADIVVAGEGELTLDELLPHLQRHGLSKLENIAGIAFRDESGVVQKTAARQQVQNLDALPFPDRAAIDLESYLQTWQHSHGRRPVSLITARGCPYTCTWCSHSVFGFSHRRRSPQNVADEVELLTQTYAPDMLWYADDVFTIHPRWFFDYARELQRRNLRLPFECISREDRLDEEIIRTLAEMGCFRLWLGSESGSQRILDAMQRRTDVERVRFVTSLLQRHGIETGMFIMLGYAGETQSDLAATVEHLKMANPDIFLTTVAYPIKGTEYYQEVSGSIRTNGPWQQTTDRDYIVTNRPSRQYYRYANQWLVHEVAYHRYRRQAHYSLKTAKAYLQSRVGKLGMAISQLFRIQ